MTKKLLIGVTGSLASGKSMVTEMLCAKGAGCIDADKVSHEVLRQNEEVKHKVMDIFGEDIFTDGEIDRRKLAGKVFFNSGRLKELCDILHPVIISRIEEQANDLETEFVVVDAPLLIETGLNEVVDVVVVVACEHDLSIERAMGRGISREEADNILKNQMPVSEKETFADYVINNDSSVEITKEGVEKLWQNLQKARQNLRKARQDPQGERKNP